MVRQGSRVGEFLAARTELVAVVSGVKCKARRGRKDAAGPGWKAWSPLTVVVSGRVVGADVL